jgi:hypothetical protein
VVGAIDKALEVPGSKFRGARKNNFKGCRHRSDAALLLFYELAANALPLERRQIIDEQFTLKVVDLML